MKTNYDLLCKQMKKVVKVGKKIDLHVNTSRTETLLFGDASIENEAEIAGMIVEKVNKFEYLGS